MREIWWDEEYPPSEWAELFDYTAAHEGVSLWDFNRWFEKVEKFFTAFFTIETEDGIEKGFIGIMFQFFMDNPILIFMIGIACAYGAFNLLSHALKVAKM